MDIGDETCTQKPFCTVSPNGTADFFPGDECNSFLRGRFIKKYKKRSVPDFVRPAIEKIEVALTRQSDVLF